MGKVTHGFRHHPLYDVWLHMRYRCHWEKNKDFQHYGGRGIIVCRKWRNDAGIFINWCLSHGYEKGLEIDRTDNDGNYTPSNCRFVTRRQNCLNKRMQCNNTSGYQGISYDKKFQKWSSKISTVNGRQGLGKFSTKREAVEVRNNYIIENNLLHEYVIQPFRSE